MAHCCGDVDDSEPPVLMDPPTLLDGDSEETRRRLSAEAFLNALRQLDLRASELIKYERRAHDNDIDNDVVRACRTEADVDEVMDCLQVWYTADRRKIVSRLFPGVAHREAAPVHGSPDSGGDGSSPESASVLPAPTPPQSDGMAADVGRQMPPQLGVVQMLMQLQQQQQQQQQQQPQQLRSPLDRGDFSFGSVQQQQQQPQQQRGQSDKPSRRRSRKVSSENEQLTKDFYLKHNTAAVIPVSKVAEGKGRKVAAASGAD